MGMKTYRRTKGNVHPGAAAAHKPVEPETVRDERLRAIDTVCTHLPEGDGRRIVLAALFQPPYRTPTDNKPRTREKVLRLNGVADGAGSAGSAS